MSETQAVNTVAEVWTVAAPVALVSDQAVYPTALRLWLHLAAEAGSSEWLSVTSTEIMRWMGLSRRSVLLAMRCLERAGWVERRARTGIGKTGKGHRPNEYRLLTEREAKP